MDTQKKTPQKKSIKEYGAENRRAARIKKQKQRRIKIILLCAAAVALVIFGGYRLFFGKNAFNVVVDGTVVSTIDKTKLTSDDITNTVTASLSKELNTNIRLTDTITFEPVHASSSKKVTVEYAVTQVKAAVHYEVEAGVILVNNSPAAVLETKQEAENLLESIKGKYAPENADVTKCTFEQAVSTINDYVDSSEILSFEEAYKKLTYTTEKEDIYTVVSGDTMWKIAERFGMTIESLKSLNSLSSDNLKIGQELKVTKQVPFLSVIYNG